MEQSAKRLSGSMRRPRSRQVSKGDDDAVRGRKSGLRGAELAPGLGFQLRQAYRAFRRGFDALLARHGVTHAQWVLLWFLARAGSLTPLELSRQAGIQKASATAVIDALKQRRLIKGDQDRADRRKVNLYLTPTGEQLVAELARCAAQIDAVAGASFTDDELARFLGLLSKVAANLDAVRQGSLEIEG